MKRQYYQFLHNLLGFDSRHVHTTRSTMFCSFDPGRLRYSQGLTLALVLAAMNNAHAAADADKLLIASYPNSVRFVYLEDKQTIAQDKRLKPIRRLQSANIQAFYTRDTVEKVKAYYENQLGPFRNGPLAAKSSGHIEIDPVITYSKIVLPATQVAALTSKRSAWPLGIEFHALNADVHTQGSDDQFTSVGPYFGKLLNLTDTCSAELAYSFVASEHRHLAASFFQLTDRKTADGKRMTIDEVIYADCDAKSNAEAHLVKHRGEARSAGESSAMMDHEGAWDKWVACLKKLDQHDFKTLIIIDRHPSQWRNE